MNMLQLSPFEFDQTYEGWRSLQDPNMQVLVLKEYIDKHIDEPGRMIEIIHFHLGQALAMRNLDENDKMYAIHHMKLSYTDEDDEWNDYVNATIAFLKKDREEFNKYLTKENYNGSVIKRLSDNFYEDYKNAY